MPSPEAMRVQDKRAVAVKNVLVEILPERKVETAALEDHDGLRVRAKKRSSEIDLYELNIYLEVDSLLFV